MARSLPAFEANFEQVRCQELNDVHGVFSHGAPANGGVRIHAAAAGIVRVEIRA
jgi:hypothetical protein